MAESKGSWGGSRSGAGNPEFKPKWKSGKTTVIRVPEAIADEVLAVARQIDEGEPVTLSSSKPEAVDSPIQHESVTQLKELYQKVGELETELFKARQGLEQVTQDRDKYFEEISEVKLELENLKSEPAVVTQSSLDAAVLLNCLKDYLVADKKGKTKLSLSKLETILEEVTHE